MNNIKIKISALTYPLSSHAKPNSLLLLLFFFPFFYLLSNCLTVLLTSLPQPNSQMIIFLEAEKQYLWAKICSAMQICLCYFKIN